MTPKKKYGIHSKRPPVNVYLSAEEKEEISQAMKLDGEAKISGFIRRAALEKARALSDSAEAIADGSVDGPGQG